MHKINSAVKYTYVIVIVQSPDLRCHLEIPFHISSDRSTVWQAQVFFNSNSHSTHISKETIEETLDNDMHFSVLWFHRTGLMIELVIEVNLARPYFSTELSFLE